MSSNDTQPDEILAGGVPENAETPESLNTSVDTSPTITPQDFQWADFLAGVHPTRRGVRLYPQAQLVARMEYLADRIEALPDGPEVDQLIDEFEQTKAAFKEGVWFEVEKRSSEWVKKFRTDLAAKLDLNLGTEEKDFADADPQHSMTAVLHQLAAQIVTPANTTYEDLHRLYEANEGELNKLIVTMGFTNEALAERAKVLDVDFSQRRSTNRKARRSSKR